MINDCDTITLVGSSTRAFGTTEEAFVDHRRTLVTNNRLLHPNEHTPTNLPYPAKFTEHPAIQKLTCHRQRETGPVLHRQPRSPPIGKGGHRREGFRGTRGQPSCLRAAFTLGVYCCCAVTAVGAACPSTRVVDGKA